MARAKTLGDLLQQQRRRYQRAAKSLAKKAAKAEGFERKALQDMARLADIRAKQSYAKKITEGITGKAEKEAAIRKHLGMDESRNFKPANFAKLNADTRRNMIGHALASGTGAKTFYAATKDWWRGSKPADRDAVIIRKLNNLVKQENGKIARYNKAHPDAKKPYLEPVSNILDAMERFQQLSGIDPFTPDFEGDASDIEKYEKQSQRARRKLR